MYRESSIRSVAKALSWRLTGSLGTFLLVLLFTRRIDLSLSIGILEVFLKIAAFYVHERVWNHVQLGRHQIRPAVLWFTGLSGAGKSTIADRVHARLLEMGLKAERLDGDGVRHIFPNTGFSREERDSHIKRVGFLASKLESNGIFVVASFVSPYRDARAFIRGLCQHFVEIHMSTPLATCEERDPKGLYRKARRGEIQHFTGVDDPYEPPEKAEITIDAGSCAIDDAVNQVIRYIESSLK